MKKYIFLLAIAACIGFACSEEERPRVKTDTIAPQPLSEVQVKNIPGGAILSYKLPDDEDLLYVKANYSLKEGTKEEVRASLYVDTLRIAGFGTQEERMVELIAVDRSENESTPVIVNIKPLEAPVITIGKTIQLISDFGGVHAYWENKERAEIAVVLEREDHNAEFVPLDTYYSSVVKGDAATRGLDTIPQKFRVYVTDRWENKSDVFETTLSPLFEEQFSSQYFSSLVLDGDEVAAFGWEIPYIWDGSIKGNGFHTANGTGRWPQVMSFDTGVTGKISRIKIWQRTENEYSFRHGNLKLFEVWGANDGEHLNDWGVWTQLMTCESVKPSGLPVGQLSAEDLAYATAGEEFTCPPTMPKVRYLRIKALENWSGGDFFHFMEIEVYGQVDK